MARRYYRRRYYRKRKYNIEQRYTNFLTPEALEHGYHQNSVEIVPASTTEGVRKVTRFMINVVANSTLPMFWALIYIPEGTQTLSSLFANGTNVFEPSQWVLATGVSKQGDGTARITSRIQKNLNAGDRIYLLTAFPQSSQQISARVLYRYAIAYN